MADITMLDFMREMLVEIKRIGDKVEALDAKVEALDAKVEVLAEDMAVVKDDLNALKKQQDMDTNTIELILAEITKIGFEQKSQRQEIEMLKAASM